MSRRRGWLTIWIAVVIANLSVAGFALATRAQQESRPAADSPVAASGRPEVFAALIDGPVALGNLRIPRINLDTAFFAGVHDEVVDLGPGLWPGTPLPGDPGNAVLAGHRTTHTHPFLHLDRLRPGDVIDATVAGRSPVGFRVVSATVVAESAYVDFVLSGGGAPEASVMTLFACSPKGRRTHRIVIRATRAG